MERIPFPRGKYQLIVVDPPWPVKKIARKVRPNQIEMDYPTMSLQEIADLPVDSIATEDAWCFLWTTQKYLFDAKAILEGWGFDRLLTMVWEKTYGRSAGMPLFGFKWNAEFILVGCKQRPPAWSKGRLIPAVFQAENVRHSQKPQRFYDLVASLGTPRIDLFARQRRDGWDAWGTLEFEEDKWKYENQVWPGLLE